MTKHHRGAIQGHTVINLQFLEDLFNKEIIPATEECGVFESLSSRRKYCGRYLSATWQLVTNCFKGRDHPQGSGRLQHTPCDVIFNALVPVDIGQCPYILFTSHGVHKHPPPPPTKCNGPKPCYLIYRYVQKNSLKKKELLVWRQRIRTCSYDQVTAGHLTWRTSLNSFDRESFMIRGTFRA